MVAQQNQINPGKDYCIPLQGMMSCLGLLYYSGLFGIIAQAALGYAKQFLE